MNDDAYRALLGLFMCSDPWPTSVDREPIETMLNDEARERGFDGWVEALHKF